MAGRPCAVAGAAEERQEAAADRATANGSTSRASALTTSASRPRLDDHVAGQGGADHQGTTILDGLKAAVKAGMTVTYAADGSGAAGADLAGSSSASGRMPRCSATPPISPSTRTTLPRFPQSRPPACPTSSWCFRPAGDPRRHRDRGRGDRRGLVAGHGRAGRRRHPDRRPQADRQAGVHLAEIGGAVPINKHSKNAAEALYPFGFGLSY